MRTELRLVLKQVIGDAEKVNAENYFAKQLQPVNEYYYEEDSYVVNEQTGGFPAELPRLQLAKLAPRSRKSRLELWKLELRGSLCSRWKLQT